MKRFLVIIILLSAVIKLSAQNQKELNVTPIVEGEFIVSELTSGDTLLIELGHSNYFYDESYDVAVFGPNNKVGFIEKICYGEKCIQKVPNDNRISGFGDLFPLRTFHSPLKMRLIKSPEKGVYEISVIRKEDAEVHHKRTFAIVDPEPTIDSVLITGFDNSVTSNQLKIDKDESLNRIKFQFLGSYLTSNFESITIQDLPLKKHPTEVSCYILDERWTTEAISKLSLGDSFIVFKRFYSDKTTKHKIKLIADSPIINVPGLEFSANIFDNKIKMTLAVQHLFPGAKLVLENHSDHPNFLQNRGEVEAEVTVATGTIAKDIFFNADKLIDIGKFHVQVINKDGKSSIAETITIVRREENVKARAYDNGNLPLVAGITNRVLFEHIGGNPFGLDQDLNFQLAINGLEPFEIQARKETNSSFSAKIKLPDGIYDLSFTLRKNNGSSWNGTLTNIRPKPILEFAHENVYRGGNFKVYVQNATDTRILPVDKTNIIEIPNGTDKSFDISVDKESRLTQFILTLKLKEHVIAREAINISNWPEPKKRDILILGGEIRDDRLILEKGGDIDLIFQADKDNLQRFSAQLRKGDGTLLGVPKPMILDVQDEGNNQIKTRLSTVQSGLQHGESFNIEIVNPAGDAFLYPGYIKRSGREQWIITAGISLLNIPFEGGQDASGTSTRKMFDGVNIAGYYMVENINNPSNRWIGIGPNLLISENEGNVRLGGAISVLLFEKLVLGLSFDKNGLGMLAGANIELADFTSIFGSSKE